MAGPVDAIMQRAEELLRGAGGAIDRVAEELPQVAALLRSEPRLRAALTDIAVGARAKHELLRSLFGERVDPATLGVLGLLVEELLSPEELERAASDLVVRALLAAAEADGSLEDAEDELFRFARIIDGSPELRTALTDPVQDDDARRAIVRDLLSERARPVTVTLVEFVLSTGLERDPSQALQDLAELAAARRGRVVVEARTAIPIDVQRRARLAEALSRTVGRQIDLEIVIDPEVLGGVVARVGDELIDGTVKRKLEQAMEELTA